MTDAPDILSRREMEERLAATAYDQGEPDKWPEMHMSAVRCGSCGRWLQIVRPGKYQCECEHETVPAWRERQALEGMRWLARRAEVVLKAIVGQDCDGCRHDGVDCQVDEPPPFPCEEDEAALCAWLEGKNEDT